MFYPIFAIDQVLRNRKKEKIPVVTTEIEIN